MQRTGRIGGIEVDLNSENGKTEGKTFIPSSLDSSETALIAVSLETIERIGPCNSEVKVKNLKDMRAVKREFVIERAQGILKNMVEEEIPATSVMTEKIREAIRASEIKNYANLPCGPDMLNSDEIVVVEGRADVLNLIKWGEKRDLHDGTKIPQAIADPSKERIVTEVAS